MSVLIFDTRIKAQIQKAIKAAWDNPIPWEALAGIASIDPTEDLPSYKVAEEVDKIYEKYPTQNLMIGTVRVAFSFERQPNGLFRHISFATGRKGKVLDFIASEVLVKEFGFSGLPPKNAYRIWNEEYEQGMFAINILELVVEAPTGEVQNVIQ